MKNHQDCKFFGRRGCEHKNDEIMKRAARDIPQYHGGKVQILDFPTNEEIDAICSLCQKFTKRS